MNLFVFMGRLTKDPVIRYTGEQMAIADFSIAVDRRVKKEGGTNADFFNVTAFDKKAEFAEKYLRKGTKVVVTGRIHNNNYTDKEGRKVYGYQFVADSIEFAESKKSQEAEPEAQPESQADGFMNIPDGVADEELPFI